MNIFNALLCFLVGGFILWNIIFGGPYPSENLENYRFQSINVAQSKIEKHKGWSLRPSKNEYYELAVYTKNGERYYLRAPESKQFINIGSQIRENMNLDLYFEPERGDQKGGRIAHLKNQNRIIVNLEELYLEQNKKRKLILFPAFMLILFGVLFLIKFKIANKSSKQDAEKRASS